MKKLVLSAMLATAFINAKAQAVTDTVSIGASYANQAWYSLPNGIVASAVENNWDIAFDVSGMGAGAMINSAKGVMLWKYPAADTTGWNTLDTAGLSTWTPHYNSDTSWTLGAMGNYDSPANPFDLDWGVYNLTTHIVTGDSIYVIQLTDGTFRKLWIQSLSGGIYTFVYANLNGTASQTGTIDKSAYTGKNFGYYSIQSGLPVDREPLSANWDLTFTQYTGFVPVPYTLTGVLGNENVQVAKESGIADVATYTDYSSAAFTTRINAIGYDWKTYTGTYTVQDSLLYFVKPLSGDIWKIIFTGFGGSANGDYIFSKEKLSSATTGIANTAGTTSTATLALCPNPANGQSVNIIYSFGANVTAASLAITDVTGKTISATSLENTAGLHQYHLATQGLAAGMYLVSINAGNTELQQKLIIQ